MLRFIALFLLLASPVWADGYELGFRNSVGTQDSYNMDTGTWELQRRAPDGSVDRYDMGTGAIGLGFRNSDGSQDTYWMGTPRHSRPRRGNWDDRDGDGMDY